jgi:hypothetical protein
MATTQTSRIYALDEFVSASVVNTTIFAQELEDDENVVQKPSGVSRTATSVTVAWSGVFVTSGTLGAVDNDVVAHQGGSWASLPVTEVSESESSDDSGNEQTKLTLDTGLLPAGQYLLGWYCEIKTASEVTNTAAIAKLYVTKNGGAEVERGENVWPYPQYNDFGGGFPVTVTDGESYTMRLAYERLGASSNPVTIQRARMYCARLNT